jgi:4-amino-4-deoxy-L-arabinose transferase-like glycosyltransferase
MTASEARPGRPTRAEWLAVIAIVALAAVVRLAWPGLTEFKADEGRLLTLALQAAAGDVPLHGIATSVGFPNAPLSVWLYALPLLFWRHPFAPTLFTGLLNTLAVVGVYWLARRTWGVPAALAAALLLAAGPWAIVFSRKIWAQNLLPPFAVGWGIGAVLAFVEGRRPWVVLHLVCLALAVQLHPAAAGLAPATLLFLVVFRRRVGWGWVVLGGLLAALTVAPYLWHLWSLWRAGGLPFSTGQAAAEVSLDSLWLALSIAAGFGVEPLAGEAFALPLGAAVARWLWLGLVVAGMGYAAWRAARHWQRPSSQVGLIVLAWLLAPALLFVWHRTPVYVHYFIAGLPAACILGGVVFAATVERLAARGRGVAWAALVLTGGLLLLGWGGLMRAVVAAPGETGFGVPLRTKLAAADAARRLRDETGAAEVLPAGDGANPERHDFPAEFRALLHDVPLRYVDLNAEALFPDAAAVVLLGPAADDGPAAARDFYAAAPGVVETVETGGAVAYTVHALPPAAAPPPAVILPAPALLANFARITGYNPLRFGPDGAVWDLFWRTADNPDAADYHIFNHLLDATGARVAQADGAAFAGQQWHAGDVVVSRFVLPVPTDVAPPLTMRAGMYRFPSLESVPVLDEAANPVGDFVEITLE